MKYVVIISFFLLCQFSFGQTENHIHVSGTKCFLIPPENFEEASNFNGFQHPALGASIMINELPVSYTTLIENFTAGKLATQGMKLLSNDTIDLNGSEAFLIYASQPMYGNLFFKQILVLGDEENTVLINGVYPEESKQIETQIRKALLSTIFDASSNDDPLNSVNFTIDTETYGFKLATHLSGTLIYTTTGTIPTDGPSFIVGISLNNAEIPDKKEFAETRAKTLIKREITINKVDEITINNLDGYEIVAEGISGESPSDMIYQVILFTDGGGYYIIVGQTKQDFDTHLETFRAIAQTFKQK